MEYAVVVKQENGARAGLLIEANLDTPDEDIIRVATQEAGMTEGKIEAFIIDTAQMRRLTVNISRHFIWGT